MGKSKFKESYIFLKKHFTLMVGKPELLVYSPSTLAFHEDFYEHFDIHCKIDGPVYKLMIDVRPVGETQEFEYLTEKELIQGLKQKLEERRIIGRVKKIFPL